MYGEYVTLYSDGGEMVKVWVWCVPHLDRDVLERLARQRLTEMLAAPKITTDRLLDTSFPEEYDRMRDRYAERQANCEWD